MTFERTYDMRLVREVMCHPKIYPFISDDGSPAVEDFQPIDNPAVLYLVCKDGEELLGVWMFIPQNSVTVEVHTCLLPGHGFRRAREAAKGAAAWIWVNYTGCHRIVTTVPSFNRIAREFAEAAGMTIFGSNPASFAREGILYDQDLLGMSRPKETQCPQ